MVDVITKITTLGGHGLEDDYIAFLKGFSREELQNIKQIRHDMSRGYTFLHFAIRHGFGRAVRYLLEQNVYDMNAEPRWDVEAPLVCALRGEARGRGKYNIVELLLRSGANPNQSDVFGMPIEFTISVNFACIDSTELFVIDEPIAELLLIYGADISLVTRRNHRQVLERFEENTRVNVKPAKNDK